MAAVLTTKKTNYLNNVIAQATKLKEAADALAVLKAAWDNEFNTGQSAAIADADCAASGGTQHLTQSIVSSFFSGPNAAVATAITNNLQSLLPVLTS